MLEVHIPSVGPEAEAPRQSPEKGHMIKKLYKVPEFPSKRLPNWRTRGLEQRRQGLEAYIQGVVYLNRDVPKELLEFLSLRHFLTDPKGSSWGTMGEFLPSDSSSQLHHRPVISFSMDPYICISSPETSASGTGEGRSLVYPTQQPSHLGCCTARALCPEDLGYLQCHLPG
ncbi:sorting nexin-22 isoform 5-T5 [Molossus nigricans]